MFIGYVFSDRSELNRGNFESKNKNEIIEQGEFEPARCGLAINGL